MAHSALRFYGSRKLISSERTTGGQRRYARATLRRVAFIKAAQRIGLSLDEIAHELNTLPTGRTPTREDWAKLSRSWSVVLDARAAEIERLRTKLTGCIGCGCLSLRRCQLLNSGDTVARRGPGARYLIDDAPPPKS